MIKIDSSKNKNKTKSNNYLLYIDRMYNKLNSKISKYLSNDSRISEFIRFAIVGVIATIIHYVVYYFFLKLNLNTTVSYSIGYAVSLVFNFYLSLVFTFKTKATIRKGVGFATSHLINYTLHILFLNLYIWIGFPKLLAPLPVYASVVPINFFLLRTFFKSKHEAN